MTITITLTLEQEARLLERAAREGRNADTIVQDEVDSLLNAPPAAPNWNDIGPRIDAAYSDGPDEEERQFMQVARQHMIRMTEQEEW